MSKRDEFINGGSLVDKEKLTPREVIVFVGVRLYNDKDEYVTAQPVLSAERPVILGKTVLDIAKDYIDEAHSKQ